MKMKRCESVGESSLMEVAYVKKRAIAVITTDSSKRSKIDSGEVLVQSRSSEVQLVDRYLPVASLPDNSISPVTSGTSDHAPSSMCSSNQSNELVKDGQLESFDLKDKDLETEIFMLRNGGFSREASPSTELKPEPDEMESSTNKKPSPAISCRKPAPSKMPSAAEIEEFFSVAEKYEQKRFADKYNYDIVEDIPLEGRYQWVLLKP